MCFCDICIAGDTIQYDYIHSPSSVRQQQTPQEYVGHTLTPVRPQQTPQEYMGHTLTPVRPQQTPQEYIGHSITPQLQTSPPQYFSHSITPSRQQLQSPFYGVRQHQFYGVRPTRRFSSLQAENDVDFKTNEQESNETENAIKTKKKKLTDLTQQIKEQKDALADAKKLREAEEKLLEDAKQQTNANNDISRVLDEIAILKDKISSNKNKSVVNSICIYDYKKVQDLTHMAENFPKNRLDFDPIVVRTFMSEKIKHITAATIYKVIFKVCFVY